jgi:hypothetical protein
MTTPTAHNGSDSLRVRPAAGNGGPPPLIAQRRAFSLAELAFLVGVPLAWAVLLWFHPDVPDPDNVYGALRDEVTTYQIVHVGTFIFIPLMGVALYMLVRDLPGKAATISRVAIGPFVVCYGAWETVIGLATGALVQHANDAPAGERPAVSDAIQSVGDNLIVGEMGVLAVVGALAWITATIAASVAVRRAGATVLATVLLGLSLVVVSHPPPIGPVGLACFAAAVLLLYRLAASGRIEHRPNRVADANVHSRRVGAAMPIAGAARPARPAKRSR